MQHHCAVCGGSDGLLRDCKYCTGIYCPDHALPERHNCPGVSEIGDTGEWFLTPETEVPAQDGEEVRPRPESLEYGERRTYQSTVAGKDTSSDVAGAGSAVESGGRDEGGGKGKEKEDRTADTGFLSVLVSALRFWS